MSETPETPLLPDPQPPDRGRSFTGLSLGAGVAIGVGVGTALNNIALGIALGVAISLGLAYVFARRPPKG